jgi:hypothetical protein
VDGGINKTVSTKRRSEIFFDAGLDSRMTKQPVGQISTAFALDKAGKTGRNRAGALPENTTFF